MAAYEKYKDSGVKWLGEIPNHWEVKQLFAFCYEHYISNKGIHHQNLLSLSYGKIIRKNIESANGLLPASFDGYQIVEPGNIVLRLTDLQNDQRSLRVGLVNEEGIITSAYLALGCRTGVLPKYMYYQLHNNDILKVFYGMGGGIRQGLNFTGMRKLIAFLPPIEEQKAIVAYLDKVTGDIDRAIEVQQQMIDALNERIQIIISNAVTKGLNPDVPLRDSGIDWLGQIPAHWQVQRMRYLADITTGKRDTINRVDNGLYPFFVRSPHVERINTYSFDGEAVLMAGDGVGAGKVFHYANGKFDFHQRVYCFYNFSEILGKWLFFYLKTSFRYKIEEGGAKSTVDSVRLPWLKDFPITIPSKDEQVRIIDFVETNTKALIQQIENCKRMIDLLTERKQIIINQAVTGKEKVI